MTKSELFDRCVSRLENLCRAQRLWIKDPPGRPQHYFVDYLKIQSGVVVSTTEGEAGFITRAWGIVFVDCDRPKRCTTIHTSYYGESVALSKLWHELENI